MDNYSIGPQYKLCMKTLIKLVNFPQFMHERIAILVQKYFSRAQVIEAQMLYCEYLLSLQRWLSL